MIPYYFAHGAKLNGEINLAIPMTRDDFRFITQASSWSRDMVFYQTQHQMMSGA